MLRRLSPKENQLIAETWDFRASAERSALRRFRRLHTELINDGAPEVILNLVEQACDDEDRHIGLCDELAANYGWDRAPSPPTAHHPIGPSHLSDRDRLAYEMVAFCCITETINASMLLEVYRRTKAPDIKSTVHAILKDEVNHSKIGWAFLQHIKQEGRTSGLNPLLPRMFKGAGVEEIYEPYTDERDNAYMADYGELGFKDRTGIFEAVIRDVIFPGLDTMGLDTGPCRDWLAQTIA